MAETRRIRTPWGQHWRRIRYQLFPVAMFAGALLLSGWLWNLHVALPNSVAEVYAERFDAVSPVDGTLVAVTAKPFQLFDKVEQGQVIARLDDSQAVASLTRMRADLHHLYANLLSDEADKRERMQSRLSGERADMARLAMAVEQARFSILQLKAQIEADRILDSSLSRMYQATQEAFEKGLESNLTVMDYQMKRDEARKRLEGNQKALEDAEAQKAAADLRLTEYQQSLKDKPAVLDDVEATLSPIRQVMAQQEEDIKQLQQHLRELEIRSPVSGMVTTIYRSPGQTVRAGEPILTVASADTQYLVSYVREAQRVRPVANMKVTVLSRTIPRVTAEAWIERIGPQVEAVPLHQLRDPKVPEWGLPVRITMPKGMNLRPGELVDVSIVRPPRGEPVPPGVASSGAAAETGAVRTPGRDVGAQAE